MALPGRKSQKFHLLLIVHVLYVPTSNIIRGDNLWIVTVTAEEQSYHAALLKACLASWSGLSKSKLLCLE